MTVIAAGTVVLNGRMCRPGWLTVSGRRISDCGSGSPPGPPDADFPGATLIPGFVDMHVHGGAGAWYTDGRSDDIAAAASFHLRRGTTTTLASLVTASPAHLLDAVRGLADATRAGVIAGIHLEGPWLSRERCGAHNPAQLREPDLAEIDGLLAAADGAILMVTVAPELPGSAAAIRRFLDAGTVVAVGHTDATYEQTRQAIAAGATVGTHLFNAMRPLHHREPGPALALLQDPRVTLELIADGVHVHPALVRAVIEAASPDRVALVTDATAAAGCADGSFRLGSQEVDVVSGVARLHGTSTLAGSLATMDGVFRTVAGLASDPDEGLVAAVTMTSATPARVLGFDHVGNLRTGLDANLVVLSGDLHVSSVMVNGDWVREI
jgi:N-acetylglucosamine-6-phosphate deacetylase